MKTIIVSAVVALMACSTVVNAQKVNKLSFGLRGGVNFANIIEDGNKNFSTEIKPGFNAAAFVELPIFNGFSVQPELQFSQKGYKSSGSFLTNPYEYTATTNYVEVPLLAKIVPSPNFAIVVGPQFSFLTSTKYKFKTPNTEYEDIVDNENNDLRDNILGGVAGIEAGAGKFIFSARYSLDFQKNNGDGTSSTPRYKNQVLGLSVGFKL
ncbi:MAG: porin family protein [Bacteroidota bacterium]